MEIARLLFTQGFGSRRECQALCRAGRVRANGQLVEDPRLPVEPTHLTLEVDGRVWPVHDKVLLMLHKPAGVECSRSPSHHGSVLDLLPEPLRRRGVQPVGRLDVDTTGLLLLTDDGPLLHRLTSPRHHVRKTYEVSARHPVDDTQLRALLDGVVLHDDPAPVRALAAERTGSHTLRLTIAEGRYHQVKRMVAAAGNRVETLHRSGFGPWVLGTLAPGHWAWLDVSQPLTEPM